MAKVEIYTTPTCPYCQAAKRMLEKKGVSFEEFDVSRDPDLRENMTRRANGGYTVPQIFIDNQHIGGFDDMSELNSVGGLDALLS